VGLAQNAQLAVVEVRQHRADSVSGGVARAVALLAGDVLLLHELVGLVEFERHVFVREFGGSDVVFGNSLLDLDVDVFAVAHVLLDYVVHFEQFGFQPAEAVEHSDLVVVLAPVHESALE